MRQGTALSLILGSLTASMVLAGSAAVAQSVRDTPRLEPFDKATEDGGITVGRLTFRPTAEVGFGYDSNLDGQSDAEGSRFEKLAVGLDAEVKTGADRTRLKLLTRTYRYDDLTVDDRFDIDARLTSDLRLSETESIRLTTSYLRDAISLDRADIYESFLDYDLRSDLARAWISLASTTQLAIPSPFEADLDRESGVFDPERDEALDYTRNGLQTGIVPWPKSWITPFASGGYARVVFLDANAEPDFDRDAHDFHAIAGLRFTLGKEWRIDAGWRFNQREFADRIVPSDGNDYPDLRIEWTPSRDLTVSAKVKRAYEETTSVFALVDDVTTYSLVIDKDITDRLSLLLDASWEREVPIGDVVIYDKLVLRTTATYRHTRNVELFADSLVKYVDEHSFDSAYERYRGEIGVRLRY